MLVRKSVLPVGTHHAPNGVLNATPEWCRERAQLFADLRKRGIQFPVAWGHQSKALPLDVEKAKDEQSFFKSKYNAGTLLSFDFDEAKQELVMEADIPAAKRIDADGAIIFDTEIEGTGKVEGKIAEVSAGFWDWTDGQGKTHKDCPIHVALTPLPVVAGQSGFVPVEDTAKPVILLSTRTRFGPISESSHTPSTQPVTLATERTMPDEPKDKKPEGEKPEGDKPEGDPKKDSKLKSGKSVSERVTDIAKWLQIGTPEIIPDDADEALDLLYIAAAAIRGPASEENEIVADQSPNTGTGPVMLSTLITTGGPHVAAMKKIDKDEREKLNARIDALKGRGLSDPDFAELKGQVPKLELSLTQEGELVPHALAKTLDILERNLPTKKELATATGDVVEVELPVKDGREKSKAVLQQLEENGIIPPAKK